MSQLPVAPLDFSAALDRLDRATQRFAAAADRVRDWSAPVPTCPGWTARTLVIHVGLIHTWAASAIGAAHAPEDPPFENDGSPLPEWYRGRASALLAALREAGPEAPAWTLWGDRVAAFWARRQFHETAVHEFDLASALAAGAGDPVPWSIPDDLAIDGLREVLSGFYPRQVRLGRTPGLPAVVRFEVRTDDGETVATLDAPAFGGEDGPVLGIVAGTARELYLAVWGRGEFPGASPELVETIRGTKLTP
ncbi:maleylpyruvate isomerase N-terminal domain-containing protein [Sinomonas sp. ASV322]|uniref:maleylpyruvate isomerase N-terminal domain-containing protein n=1 Tax=Sinomonas sp. ASV322 TaxID=3041920 RepID=UPI0027DD16A6|nr:maleylpyruvate isomerase N-terminal domain-containing protein [Sinomonas sp. ASV322]MDQ4504265.1 maleylpyruvate isomerase N-terminal domain-containing protein [Sinomonas sp. ASV322]